jgi:hypothetical protein
MLKALVELPVPDRGNSLELQLEQASGMDLEVGL